MAIPSGCRFLSIYCFIFFVPFLVLAPRSASLLLSSFSLPSLRLFSFHVRHFARCLPCPLKEPASKSFLLSFQSLVLTFYVFLSFHSSLFSSLYLLAFSPLCFIFFHCSFRLTSFLQLPFFVSFLLVYFIASFLTSFSEFLLAFSISLICVLYRLFLYIFLTVSPRLSSLLSLSLFFLFPHVSFSSSSSSRLCFLPPAFLSLFFHIFLTTAGRLFVFVSFSQHLHRCYFYLVPVKQLLNHP